MELRRVFYNIKNNRVSKHNLLQLKRSIWFQPEGQSLESKGRKCVLFIVLLMICTGGNASAQQRFPLLRENFRKDMLAKVDDISLQTDFKYSILGKPLKRFRKNYHQFRVKHFSKNDSIRNWNNVGVILALNGRIKAAENKFKLAQRYEFNDSISYNQGLTCLLAQNYSAAVEYLEDGASSPNQSLNLAVAFGNSGDLYTAQSILLGCYASDSNNHLSCYNLGLVYLKLKDTITAFYYVNRAVRLNPHAEAYRICRGDLLMMREMSEQALDDYFKVYRKHPNNPAIIIKIADASFQNLQFHKAGKYYRKIVHMPNNIFTAKATYGLGNVLQAVDSMELALHYYNRAIKMAPLYADAYASRGNLYRKLNKPVLAFQDFYSSLNIDRRNKTALIGKGILHYYQGDYSEAYEAFKEVGIIKRNWIPYTEYYLTAGITCLKLDKFSEAAQYFFEVPSDKKNSIVVYMAKGMAAFENRDYEIAFKHFKKALSIKPANDSVLTAIGSTALQMGKIACAYKFLAKATSINPNNVEALNALAMTALIDYDLEKSIQTFTNAIKQFPDLPYLYNNRGMAKGFVAQHSIENNPRDSARILAIDALNDLNKTLELDSTQTFTYLNIGNVLKDTGDVTNATNFYGLYPSPFASNNLGVIAAEGGSKDEALLCFNTSIQMDSTYEEPYANRTALIAGGFHPLDTDYDWGIS